MHALADPSADTMRAIALDRHGDASVLRLRWLSIPSPGPGQLLLRVHAAGVGRWDLHQREGDFARRSGRAQAFPLVQGAEGAGVVVTGGGTRFHEGDRVYGLIAGHAPAAGFHAEFALLDAAFAWPVPPRLSLEQAAVLPVDGAVAWHGLHAVLRVRAGDTVLVHGASGGVGHMALQFARQAGARVLAIASGEDGVRMAQRLGADVAIDGRRGDRAVVRALREALDGWPAARPPRALLTAGGDTAAQVVAALPPGSRVACPQGVAPPPSRPQLLAETFPMRFDAPLLQAVHDAVARGPFVSHVSRRFPLERMAEAQQAVLQHHLGRIAVSTL